MSGWVLLLCGSVCASGVMAFLGVVANEVAAAGKQLERLERKEKQLARRRKEREEYEAPAEEPVKVA